MAIKETLKLICRLVIKPGRTWKEIADRGETKEEFQTAVFYPLLGVISLSAFVGVFINLHDFNLQMALKSAIVACISLLGGIYGASYAIEYLYARYFGGEVIPYRAFVFSGYCYAPVMLLVSVIQLFPDFFFLNALYFAIPYLVWEGMSCFFDVEQRFHSRFAILVSVLLLVVPWLLKAIMFLFMPGLRI